MNKILIVGLGNPGEHYKLTKHNAGFLAIDNFAQKHDMVFEKTMFNGIYAKKNLFNKEVFLLKPQTFMNLSGKCVFDFVNYFKFELKNIFIIYDDLDILIGKFKFKRNGSSGGQNGMKNIIELLKTQEIQRYKIGIGIENRKLDAASYVLSKFSSEQQLIIQKVIQKVTKEINEMIQF